MIFEKIDITINKDLMLTQGYTIPSGSHVCIETFNQVMELGGLKYYVFPLFWYNQASCDTKKGLLTVDGIHEVGELVDEATGEYSTGLTSTHCELIIDIASQDDIDTLAKCKALVIGDLAAKLGFLVGDFS